MHRTFLLWLAIVPMASGQVRLADPFAPGWMLTDTNGDGIVDFVAGKIVVSVRPRAAENAAAANIAARLGYSTTGLTPPLVISAAEDSGGGPRIFIRGNDARNLQ